MKKFLLLFVTLLVCIFSLDAQQIQESALRQIESLQQEKESRTPAQKKMDSQLWYALKQERGQAITSQVATLAINVNREANGRVPVDISATVTPGLLATIKAAGGEITFSSDKFQSVSAKIPVLNLEKIAALPEVRFIGQALPPALVGAKPNFAPVTTAPLKAPVTTLEERKKNVTTQLLKALEYKTFIGSVTSEGDITHKAAAARTTFGINGAGIKIGVISDSYDAKAGAAANVVSGDLPGPGNPFGFTTPVTVLQDYASGTDEGRAMANIVHDLAPGAQLFFATADVGGQAGFAQAILNLRAAGCDIICDDVFYYAEPVFQDGVIAQAVNTVTASGALYFSSAGNQGNKNDNTSTVWEGDFVDGGANALLTGGTVNNFNPSGTATLYNQILSNGGYLKLAWSDALGKSANDYDIYVLNAAMTTVVASGTTVQNGTNDPLELITGQAAGNRVVIFKKTGGAARALHLNGFNQGTNGFAFTTQGQTSGHSSAANAFSVAATPAAADGFGGPNGPYPGPFVTTNLVERFSSDGPRAIFYKADSTAVTAGNFLFATNGGTVRQKPDITAANGVSTAVAGFSPFFGTSAAAPHAAAIAGLIKSYIPTITAAQVRTLLTSTALDIETAGVDRNSGAGIIMPFEALAASCKPAILSQPTSTTVCVGNSTTFSIVSSGAAPVTYQWQVSTDNGATYTNIAGATAASYTFTAAAGDNGKLFRAIATGTCGAATSAGGKVTITSASAGGTLSPANASACGVPSYSGTFTLSGYSGNIIQWEQSTDGGATWTVINNTTTTLNYTASVTTIYRALVQGGGCASSAYSTTATFTMVAGQTLTIVADPGTTLCAGDPTRLTVSETPVPPATATMSQTVTTSNSAITFNFRNNNAFAVMITNINSICNFNGGTAIVSAYYKASAINGAPGAITTANGWNQFGSNSFPSTNGAIIPFMSGLNLIVPANSTYGIVINSTNTTLGVNNIVYSNALTTPIASAAGCDIITGANIGYSGAPVPAAPTTTPRYFIGSVTFIAAPTPVTTGTYTWTPAAGLSNTVGNPVAASPTTTTTYSVTSDNGAGCVRNASILITVNQRPAVTAQPTNTTACVGSTVTFTAAGTGTNFAYQWQESTNGGTSYNNITNGGIYSGATTGSLKLTGVTLAMNNYVYRLSVSGTCNPVANSTGAVLTVLGLPTVAVGPNNQCGPVTLTATGASTYSWSPAAGLSATTGATVIASPTSNTIYTVTGTNSTTGCSGTATVTVNYTPLAPTVNPSSATICSSGAPVPLTITSSLLPITQTFASGTISVNIPDGPALPYTPGYVFPATTTVIPVTGIPAGAVMNGLSVKLNITHTYVSDLVIVLQAPNGNIFNLDAAATTTGKAGANFVNTVISSIGTAQLGTGTTPGYTGTFAPDAAGATFVTSGLSFPGGPVGYVPNVSTFNGLYSIPNGNWTLAVYDYGSGDVGRITSWSIDVTYGIASSGIWAPNTGLFLDAAGAIPYAGTLANVVYAKPAASTNYTVTVNTGNCNSPATTVPVTVNTPAAITTQPVAATVCTDKVTSFTTVATGSAITHNWRVQTVTGGAWADVANGGVYAGAKTGTLVITAPPVSMNGYSYKDSVSTTPCAAAVSNTVKLTVNPLPVITLQVAPYRKLYPGLTTTLAATVTPAAATYTWLKNGTAVANATAGSLKVDVDNLGDYSLRVTDINGCTATSGIISITDSANGKFFIYPNPNSGQFYVRYYSVANNSNLVRGLNVYDARGKRVLTKTYSTSAPYAALYVDISNQSTGVYWIELVDLAGNRLALGRTEVLR